MNKKQEIQKRGVTYIVTSTPVGNGRYRGILYALHPGTGKAITQHMLSDATGSGSLSSKRVTRQCYADTPEEAEAGATKKIDELSKTLAPLLRTVYDDMDTLRSLYDRCNDIFLSAMKGQRDADAYIRDHMLSAFDNVPLSNINNDMAKKYLSATKRDADKKGLDPATHNHHIRWIKAVLCTLRDVYHVQITDPDVLVAPYMAPQIRRAYDANQYVGHLSTADRAAMIAYCLHHHCDVAARAIALIYNIGDISQICALDYEDIETGSDDIMTVWTQHTMVRHDHKYTRRLVKKSADMRRLPLMAPSVQILQHHKLTRNIVVGVGETHPLLGRGPAGTVRTTPDDARRAIVKAMRDLDVTVTIAPQTSTISDSIYIRVLLADVNYCARSVMGLRDNEARLVTGQSQVSVNARNYWDADSDDVMQRIYWASRRMLPHTSISTEDIGVRTYTIGTDGTLTIIGKGNTNTIIDTDTSIQGVLYADHGFVNK